VLKNKTPIKNVSRNFQVVVNDINSKIKYMKKLYKSDTNKVFAGVIGGIEEYFDIDPVILRVL